MRWLKTLVIGMGIAIVIGLTVVIVEVAQRADGPTQSAAYRPIPPAPPVIGASSPVSVPVPTRMFGDISIAIPPGAAAEEIVTDSARVCCSAAVIRWPGGIVDDRCSDWQKTGGDYASITAPKGGRQNQAKAF